MDALYQEHILEHYKHPHNRRRMDDFDIKQKKSNASCGDDLVLYLKWEGDTLADVAFEGFGCALSQSGASMLTDKIKGMQKAAIEAFSEDDMLALFGTTISRERMQCAMLARETLREMFEAK